MTRLEMLKRRIKKLEDKEPFFIPLFKEHKLVEILEVLVPKDSTIIREYCLDGVYKIESFVPTVIYKVGNKRKVENLVVQPLTKTIIENRGLNKDFVKKFEDILNLDSADVISLNFFTKNVYPFENCTYRAFDSIDNCLQHDFDIHGGFNV